MKRYKLLILSLWLLLFISSIPLTTCGQVVVIDTVSKSILTQDPLPKEYSLGLDIFKNVPLWLRGNEAPLLFDEYGTQKDRLILEIAGRMRRNETQNWVGQLGYTQLAIEYSKGIKEREEITGWYAKAGKERTLFKKGIYQGYIGYLGVLSYNRFLVDVRFPGPTYGDYTLQRLIQNAGIGVEPYLSFDLRGGSHWLLRWVTRLNFNYRLIGKEITEYYPGVGVRASTTYNYIVSGGTTLQLHYQWKGR